MKKKTEHIFRFLSMATVITIVSLDFSLLTKYNTIFEKSHQKLDIVFLHQEKLALVGFYEFNAKSHQN